MVSRSGSVRPPSTWRFLTTFCAVALVGFALEVLPWVAAHVLTPLTQALAAAAGGLIQLVGGSAEVTGVTIRHAGGFAVAVANGCTGIEAVILLAAGVSAFPARWTQRCLGLVIGAAALLAINLLRIISLFYLGQYSTVWFEWAHLHAWDVLVMVDGLIIFLLWIRWLPAPARQRPGHGPA